MISNKFQLSFFKNKNIMLADKVHQNISSLFICEISQNYKFFSIFSMENRNQWFKDLIVLMNKDNLYERAILKGYQEYQLKSFKLKQLTPNKMLHLYEYTKTKFYHNTQSQNKDIWHENQLRIFIWVLVCYCYQNQKTIDKIDHNQWSLFSAFLNDKNIDILRYQTNFITKNCSKSKKWSKDEADTLSRIVESQEIKNKWNEIAKCLYIKSDKKFFRTPKQCREQWINHLDPNKKRTSWTLSEDFELIQCVMRNGRKWSKIAKELGEKRTEHMVKNRFKSLINVEKKRFSDDIDEEILIKKVYQRLNSCQSLKQLQAMKKEMKKREIHEKQMEKIKEEEQKIQENQCFDLDFKESQEGTESWHWNNELEVGVKAFPEELPEIEMDNEYIGYFFQEPSFPFL